ncbi:Cytochrome P450 [Rhynchospora pubera]|uniref:Cytochrome P450 n=1 Tax=Rhynchospora pubera TaxID=906938 RepID=A0AAV8CKQ6_9POAL|nr:Cytochrome P450 [Rhynchospora pubera]
MFPLFVLLLPFPLLFLLAKLRKSRKNLPFPCPRKLPIIGNLHQLSAHPHHSLHMLSLKHGPVMFLQLGSVPTFVISTADALREVLKTNDVTLSNRPSLYAVKRYSYGLLSLSFSPYGEYWRQARKVSISELLSVKRVQSFHRIREEEVANLISDIVKACSSSNPVNMSVELQDLSNKIITRVTFGDGIVAQGYGQILEETQRVLGGLWLADYLPWLGWIDALTGLRKKLEKNFKELDEFYNHVIKEHMSGGTQDHDPSDLVHVLLQLHKDPFHGMTFSSMSHVKGIITDMFINGTDTSSATLTWIMTELMRNPRVMAKARDEVRKIAGDKGKVEEYELKDLAYLKLVIKETMRLRTPVPLVFRETSETCVIQGHEVPAKTRVIINARAISLDQNTWENPEEFYPERFVDNNVDFIGQDFSLVPFGLGRRSCPGINFALPVVELALANLLYCFDWELPAGMTKVELDVEEELGIAVHKKNPLVLVPRLFHCVQNDLR